MKFATTFEQWTKFYLPIFRSNEEFKYIFDHKCSNKAFNIFGLEYSYSGNSNDVEFNVIDPKLWFLTKIKYGI